MTKVECEVVPDEVRKATRLASRPTWDLIADEVRAGRTVLVRGVSRQTPTTMLRVRRGIDIHVAAHEEGWIVWAKEV